MVAVGPVAGRYPSKDSESSIDTPLNSPRVKSPVDVESENQMQPVSLEPVNFPHAPHPDYQKCATKIQAAYRGHRARGELCASIESQQ